MMKSQSWLVAMISVALLGACSSSDVEEEPISELKPINATISPKITWEESVGSGVGDYYSQLQPEIQYGKIFAADRDGVVVAYDQATGDLVWEQDFSDAFRDGLLSKNKGARIAAGLSAGRNKLFIGSESGVLAALDVETGELVWHAQASGELLSKPIIAEDLVVVNTGAGTLEAFDVESGASKWQFEANMPTLTLRGTGSPAYEAGGFFVGTPDGKISVIIKDNGQPAWEQAVYQPKGGNEFTRMADVDMTPLIVGDTLYAASYNGNLAALELRSGRVMWQRKYSSFHNLALLGLNLILVDDRGRIYAIDRRNGQELWTNSELTNRQVTGAVLFNDYIVVGDFEGYLHFLNREGEMIGRVQVDSSGLFATPVVADNKLYTQSRDGDLVAVEVAEITAE